MAWRTPCPVASSISSGWKSPVIGRPESSEGSGHPIRRDLVTPIGADMDPSMKVAIRWLRPCSPAPSYRLHSLTEWCSHSVASRDAPRSPWIVETPTISWWASLARAHLAYAGCASGRVGPPLTAGFARRACGGKVALPAAQRRALCLTADALLRAEFHAAMQACRQPLADVPRATCLAPVQPGAIAQPRRQGAVLE